jgi:hypothetical protein
MVGVNIRGSNSNNRTDIVSRCPDPPPQTTS